MLLVASTEQQAEKQLSSFNKDDKVGILSISPSTNQIEYDLEIFCCSNIDFRLFLLSYERI